MLKGDKLWRMGLRRAELICSICLVLAGVVDARPRFEPQFRNDIRVPHSEDAQIVQIVHSYKRGEVEELHVFGLVHGHFLGDGQETAVVAAGWQVQGGFSPVTFLVSKAEGAWRIERPEISETLAFCRVIPAGMEKDTLLCQSDLAGPIGRFGRGEVDTNLYSVDFTRDPSVSYLLHVEDTVTTGRQCVAWASVKAVEFSNETLRVLVEYGREQLPGEQKAQTDFKERAMRSDGSPRGFPKRPFSLEFIMGSSGFAIADRSRDDYAYVTARWASDQRQACAARSGPAGQ